jgi:hypothetical protein
MVATAPQSILSVAVTIALGCLWFSRAVSAGGAFGSNRARHWAISGRMMSPEQASDLEQRLAVDPHDVEARTKLLGYYFVREDAFEAARVRRREHVLWLIANQPGGDAVRLSFAALTRERDGEAYAQSLALWRACAEGPCEDLGVLENAAAALVLDDPELATRLIEGGAAREPRNLAWSRPLARARAAIEGRETSH